jgi:hypothetical protein
MEMGAIGNPMELQAKGELYTCPICHYADGFHIAFKINDRNEAEIILICPSCHQRFRINWNVQLSTDSLT